VAPPGQPLSHAMSVAGGTISATFTFDADGPSLTPR
jgi:hypothetical protein